MDVSYSVWREVAAERGVVSGESFSFLFDRRYTNRLNRMSRVFFEAYATATREVAAEEDRFPSLSEIESRMESGAIYAYKDRLMRSTGFFEEVKISGISYLIPKAKSFADETGTYTDLILDLEKGEVVLPRREKPSAGPRPEAIGDEEEEMEPDLQDGSGELSEPSSELGEDRPEEAAPPPQKPPGVAGGGETAQELEAFGAKRGEEESGVTPGAKVDASQACQEDLPLVVGDEKGVDAYESGIPAGGPADEMGEKKGAGEEGELPPPGDDIFVEMEESEAKSEGRAADLGAVDPGAQASGPDRKPQGEMVALPPSKPSAPSRKPDEGRGGWWRDKKALLLAGIALLLIVSGVYLWSPGTPEPPPVPVKPSDFVSFSAYLTTASESTYMNLDITNRQGLDSKVELVLPADVDKSISATGGIVTIYYTNNTIIRLVSSNNASISVALTDEYVLVPVTFNLGIPEEHESSILVYDKDYRVSRTNNTIILWSNITTDPLEFDQIYNVKRASGGSGPEAAGPGNATAGPRAGAPGPEA
ncbi:hypothetical protein [Candidatus Methanocrinis natronophilus]|uniref:Uncharacterized protein n=1 Tax=Candidatus Methanocrinis natronophilus TaxID=3033396 RepID=A0ABT5X5U9_9EURY|nr:hypothetical protein [Candidatus Methanocrinis natronophilus]MDF0590066.1 hypothetical protein [Candidatus Methanocrinis natronophilus]